MCMVFAAVYAIDLWEKFIHVYLAIMNKHIAQIPQCNSPISHNVPHFVTKNVRVHIPVTEWSIME